MTKFYNFSEAKWAAMERLARWVEKRIREENKRRARCRSKHCNFCSQIAAYVMRVHI